MPVRSQSLINELLIKYSSLWYAKVVTCRREWQPLQYSCLENSMDRAAWRATVYGVLKSWTGGGNGNPLQYSCLENPMDCSIWGHESWTQLSNSAQHIYTIYRLFCSLINTSSCINTFACWQIHTIFITLLITIPLAICMII